MNIFEYADFRQYLREFYQKEKSQNRKFSHRYINQKVGASSSGWFSDLIKARNKLSPVYFSKLCNVLGLSHREIEYFEALVAYDEAVTLDDKNRYFEKILSFKEVSAELIGKDKFEFYSKWYYSAIRELLFFYNFQGNYKELARKLNPSIPTSEAKKTVETLKRLGLIKKNSQGCLRPTSEIIKKDSSFKSLGLANLLASQMTLGTEALKRFDKEKRDVSSMTISYSEKAFADVKEELKRVKKKLLTIANKDTTPSKVYQFNMQMFPITKDD
ncbi:MAG: TIGR02147 family protein [Fibrobacteria bacterium]|nr:TIGR02147 family protein [Fibrobacteria bacterium]